MVWNNDMMGEIMERMSLTTLTVLYEMSRRMNRLVGGECARRGLMRVHRYKTGGVIRYPRVSLWYSSLEDNYEEPYIPTVDAESIDICYSMMGHTTCCIPTQRLRKISCDPGSYEPFYRLKYYRELQELQLIDILDNNQLHHVMACRNLRVLDIEARVNSMGQRVVEINIYGQLPYLEILKLETCVITSIRHDRLMRLELTDCIVSNQIDIRLPALTYLSCLGPCFNLRIIGSWIMPQLRTLITLADADDEITLFHMMDESTIGHLLRLEHVRGALMVGDYRGLSNLKLMELPVSLDDREVPEGCVVCGI
jgi:hypothetical protein